MEEVTFHVGYRCGPFKREVGQAALRVRIAITPQLVRRIEQILDANRAFGRDQIRITPDQPASVEPLLAEAVTIRGVELIVRHNGELGVHVVDQHWRVLRERDRAQPVTRVFSGSLVDG